MGNEASRGRRDGSSGSAATTTTTTTTTYYSNSGASIHRLREDNASLYHRLRHAELELAAARRELDAARRRIAVGTPDEQALVKYIDSRMAGLSAATSDKLQAMECLFRSSLAGALSNAVPEGEQCPASQDLSSVVLQPMESTASTAESPTKPLPPLLQLPLELLHRLLGFAHHATLRELRQVSRHARAVVFHHVSVDPARQAQPVTLYNKLAVVPELLQQVFDPTTGVLGLTQTISLVNCCPVSVSFLPTTVTSLDLGEHHLESRSDSLAFAHLTRLRELRLRNLCLSSPDDLAAVLSHVPQLQSLELLHTRGCSAAYLTACLAAALLPSLSQLRVSLCASEEESEEGRLELSSSVLSVAALTRLTHLSSPFSRVSLQPFTRLTRLRALRVEDTLAGLDLTLLPHLTALDMDVTPADVPLLCQLSQLRHLCVRQRKQLLSHTHVAALARALTQLTRLDYTYHDAQSLSGVPLSCLTRLTELSLCGCRAGDAILAHARHLSGLTSLDVDHNCLTLAGVTALCGDSATELPLLPLPRLAKLHLRHNPVGAEGVRRLASALPRQCETSRSVSPGSADVGVRAEVVPCVAALRRLRRFCGMELGVSTDLTGEILALLK